MRSKRFSVLVLIIVAFVASSDAQQNPFSSIFEGMRRLLQRGMDVAKNMRKNLQNSVPKTKSTENSDSMEGSVENSRDNKPRDQSSPEEEESKFVENSPLLINKYY